jgi:hypothetical protein
MDGYRRYFMVEALTPGRGTRLLPPQVPHARVAEV